MTIEKTNNLKILDLFCGLGSLMKAFQLSEKMHIVYVSDRRTAVMLVKGKIDKKAEKSEKEDSKKQEIKIYAFLVPNMFVVVIRILSRLAQSKIGQFVKKIIYDVVKGVLVKIIYETILSLIHDEKTKLQLSYD